MGVILRCANNPQQPPESIVRDVPRDLSNELSRLTLAYVDRIDPTTDISMQLVGNFGGFLMCVPARLGRNESLDAAADLLVSTYSRFRTGHLTPTTEILTKHSRALNALGRCLDDPVKASASETLASVWLLMISQMFTGQKPHPGMSHSVGAAQILKARGYAGARDKFEQILLASLRGPVVVEALSDTRIQFTPQEWADLVVIGLDNGTLEGEMMTCLGRLPHLLQRGRLALKHSFNGEPVERIRNELYDVYQTYAPVVASLRHRWRNIDTNTLNNPMLNTAQKRIMHCNHSRIFAFGLAIGLIINSALCTLSVPTNEIALIRDESTSMASEILELAPIVGMYRPLGAAAMTLCLGAAWVAAGDSRIREQIEAMAMDFQGDFHSEGTRITKADLCWYSMRFNLEG
ncbi:hypothetical protein ACLMJK_004412 [Lecanora helva]